MSILSKVFGGNVDILDKITSVTIDRRKAGRGLVLDYVVDKHSCSGVIIKSIQPVNPKDGVYCIEYSDGSKKLLYHVVSVTYEGNPFNDV